MDSVILATAEETADAALDTAITKGIAPEMSQSAMATLRIAAITYLNTLERISVSLNNFKIGLKHYRDMRHQIKAGNISLIDEYEKEKIKIRNFLNTSQTLKDLYESSFTFQKALNTALGQKIVTVFVFEGANGPELWEVDSKDMIKFDYDRYGNIVGRYQNLTKDLQKSFHKLEVASAFEKSNPAKSAGLKATYQEVMRRYEIGVAHKWRVVLWKINNTWEGQKVSAAGDIAEAYVAFVLLDKPTPTFLNGMEENVRDFMQQGVSQVDNISGMLQGDITVGNIEYAIKSVDASTLGLKQLEVLAKEIVADADYDIEKLRTKKETLAARGRLRNKAATMLQDKVDELAELLYLGI